VTPSNAPRLSQRIIQALESLLFGHRIWVLTAFAVVTVVLVGAATRLRIDASFNKSLPKDHPYIKVFTHHQSEFGGANRVLIALIARDGNMFSPSFFAALKAATDEVFFCPGVDRAQVQSIFTPNVRYIEVVEDGLTGGSVIPADFTPTTEGFRRVRENIIKSNRVGQLVANDFSGAIISAQLQEIDPATGQKLDYQKVAAALETRVRDRFQSDEISVHIIGFAKVMGDVADGARGVALFFLVALGITTLLVWEFAGRWKLAGALLLCSLIAVSWQIGTLTLLGFGIDPMSILVPFLIFAIAVSHGVQMVRAYRDAVFSGLDGPAAARVAFRQLIVPGGLALITDTIGFITMLVIRIDTVRELAIAASLGVGLILLTNLLLLPILLSFLKLPASYQAWAEKRRDRTDRFWRKYCELFTPGRAAVAIGVSTAVGVWAWNKSGEVRVGDSQAGVPELRQDSRYNQDSRTIISRFSIGIDVITVFAEAGPNASVDYDVVSAMDRLEGRLRNLPVVQSVVSLSSLAKGVNSAWNEGSLKWRVLPRDSSALAQATSPIETATGMLNSDASVMPIMVFLTDHRAETLESVTQTIEDFIAEHSPDKVRFRLAGGNAGVMAATNDVVQAAQTPIVLWVFGSVIVLCLLVFRSLRATLCIVLPLGLVSYLGYALMVFLDIGLKTATLPVVALGVGIGVDYGIYIFAVLQRELDNGVAFADALFHAFRDTGGAVVFTGLTLAAGVGTWAQSALKFQADMGVLLSFMFLVNMLAAVLLLPALALWLYRRPSLRSSS
jgi:hypothetical protein